MGPVWPEETAKPAGLDIPKGECNSFRDMDVSELMVLAGLAGIEPAAEEREKLAETLGRMLERLSDMADSGLSGGFRGGEAPGGERRTPAEELSGEASAAPAAGRLRADTAVLFADPDALLKNAPEREGRFIVIPNIL